MFKRGNRSDCSNYCGIELMSLAGKILDHILFNRLTSPAEEVLPEFQCAFRSFRGIIDIIFVARQLQEKL